MAFVKKSINPNTVRLKPRSFNKKGNANSAPNVMIRFFQFMSWDGKRDFPFSLVFFRLERTRFNKEKNPRRKAARNGTRPDPGSPKLPKEAFTEAINKTPATSNKKMLLI
jgi:hypothetical protein